MKKQEIEQALRRASDQLPRANYERAAHTPVQRMEVHDYITRQTPTPRRPRRLIPLAAAACLLLLICGGGWYYNQFMMVYSTLYLDINPSFAITLNREDKVLDVEAQNDDAAALLEGRSYRSWTLDATLGVLADDMAATGYLTSPQDTVSVSVESRSEDRAKVLKMETETFFAQRLDSSAESAAQERITPEEAKNAIWAKEPSARIHEAKLDQNDDGVWVYEIECYVGEEKYDAEVDAMSGALLLWTPDD
ncbi:MAG: hypothetical protein EOM52_06230 [Clostridia bacterium]|nr:hypothetical protein [Clostridia bacterium]